MNKYIIQIIEMDQENKHKQLSCINYPLSSFNLHAKSWNYALWFWWLKFNFEWRREQRATIEIHSIPLDQHNNIIRCIVSLLFKRVNVSPMQECERWTLNMSIEQNCPNAHLLINAEANRANVQKKKIYFLNISYLAIQS